MRIRSVGKQGDRYRVETDRGDVLTFVVSLAVDETLSLLGKPRWAGRQPAKAAELIDAAKEAALLVAGVTSH